MFDACKRVSSNCPSLQNGGDQQRLELFKPAFSQLVTLICGRVCYPEDWDSLHQDERDDFKQQRYGVADTLLDAAGSLACWMRIAFMRMLWLGCCHLMRLSKCCRKALA